MLANQKIEDLLNLALSATEEERQKSENLNIGYDSESRTWEIIVKYVGDIMSLVPSYPGISIVPLLGQYAIIRIAENQLEDFSNEELITYIEKSKRLVFSVVQGRIASCINPVQAMPLNLTGKGVLAAIIDSGIDFTHPDFRNEDGSTRIEALWDQTISGNPPEGYKIGTLYTRQQIDQALQAGNSKEQAAIVGSRDISGHGTAVAGIMAGNGRSSGNVNRGVAPGSDLLIVKLGTPERQGFPRTTELMQGVDFVLRKAMELGKPVAVNISFGNSYGSHDGNSLLESYINTVSQIWKNSIAIAAGNDASSSGHFSTVISAGKPLDVTLAVGAYESVLNVQIWKSYGDEIDIEIVSPSGQSSGAIKKILGPQRFTLGDTEILLYYGEPSPYNQAQEIYIDFLPEDRYVTEGLWSIRLVSRRVVQGNVEMWLPTAGVLNRNTGFLLPEQNLTVTIPGTAENAVTVGAYDAWLDYYADFSG
ncbi:MAG: S8 family peptidase, partial [Coprococcus sp.]